MTSEEITNALDVVIGPMEEIESLAGSPDVLFDGSEHEAADPWTMFSAYTQLAVDEKPRSVTVAAIHDDCSSPKVYPLTYVIRPVAWTRSNILLVPDPTTPTIHAHQIPRVSSSKSSPIHFTLPQPMPILSMPAAFFPATILQLGPRDELLFAYFPSAPGIPTLQGVVGSLACVWQKTEALDVWLVKEFWRVDEGHGIVTMRWLDEEREVEILCFRHCFHRMVRKLITSSYH